MSDANTSHYLTNVYTAILIPAIQSVREAIAEGSVTELWYRTEALYTILPPDVYDEVKDDYDRIKTEMSRIKASTKSSDVLLYQANMEDKLTVVWRRNNQGFIEKCIRLLFRNGYFERLGPATRKKDLKELEGKIHA